MAKGEENWKVWRVCRCYGVVQVDVRASVARMNSIGGANRGKDIVDVVVGLLVRVDGTEKFNNDAGEERVDDGRQRQRMVNRWMDRREAERNRTEPKRGVEWEGVTETERRERSSKQAINENDQGGAHKPSQ